METEDNVLVSNSVFTCNNEIDECTQEFIDMLVNIRRLRVLGIITELEYWRFVYERKLPELRELAAY